jgi:hypothetical protein
MTVQHAIHFIGEMTLEAYHSGAREDIAFVPRRAYTFDRRLTDQTSNMLTDDGKRAYSQLAAIPGVKRLTMEDYGFIRVEIDLYQPDVTWDTVHPGVISIIENCIYHGESCAEINDGVTWPHSSSDF